MSENYPDILVIDSTIKSIFKEQYQNLGIYRQKLSELKITREGNIPSRLKNNLLKTISELEEKIVSIENCTDKNFYLIETTPYIEKYKEIISTPLEVNFVGKQVKSDTKKREIVDKYLSLIQKYYKINIEKKEKNSKIQCASCQNKKEFDILDDIVYVCKKCGTEKEILPQTISYKDIDRVNISAKYSYDRKVHFRDCINQYQGKQNSTIDQKVYESLEDQFERHHLLVGDKDSPKEIRFSKITKMHVGMFLKELGLSKHYENTNLIHYNLTGVKPDDISYLEDTLLADFDLLVEEYDKMFKHKIDRSSFINTQYVLYQLLLRHKHPCKKEDFAILKTIDKQNFHDDICGMVFSRLGWNIVPMY